MSNIDERTGKPKIILHLFAKAGSDTQDYADAGYDRRIIGEDIGVENYTPPPYVYGIIANPPCTMFSIGRTNAKTPRDLREGMSNVREALRVIWECQFNTSYVKVNQSAHSPLQFWAIENPGSGMLKWFLGNPVVMYQPYEWGENYSKSTALWGRFNLPIKNLLYNPIARKRSISDLILPGGDKEERMQKRSMCCKAFAKAFFEINQ